MQTIPNLEAKLKKVTRIQTLLIIVLCIAALATIFIWGDVSSAKKMVENRYADQMAEMDNEIKAINEDIADTKENIAKYEAEIAGYEADIAAVKDGSYTK